MFSTLKFSFTAICFLLFAEVFSGQAIEVGSAQMDLIWDQKPLMATKFANGDKIAIAASSREWKNLCQAGKPALYVHTDLVEGKTVYFYNFYAVSDKRGIVPQGSQIPNYTLLKSLDKTQQGNFPFTSLLKDYLVFDFDANSFDFVQSSDISFWTNTMHESARDGENISYIGNASTDDKTLSLSIGNFWDGYQILTYKNKPKKQYDYRSVLPFEYGELIESLNQEIGNYEFQSFKDTVQFEGVLSFNESGNNNSIEFEIADESDFKPKKLDLSPLNTALMGWSQYPVCFGTALPVRQSVLLKVWVNHEIKNWKAIQGFHGLSSEKKLLFNQVEFIGLKSNDDKRVLKKSLDIGRADEFTSHQLWGATTNSPRSYSELHTFSKLKTRGFGNVLLSPFGQGTRQMSFNYSNEYKGARVLGKVLAYTMPFVIAAGGVSLYQKFIYQDRVNNPSLNSSTFLNDKKQLNFYTQLSQALIGTYGLLVTIDLSASIRLGFRNVTQRRKFNHLRKQYPDGFAFKKREQSPSLTE